MVISLQFENQIVIVPENKNIYNIIFSNNVNYTLFNLYYLMIKSIFYYYVLILLTSNNIFLNFSHYRFIKKKKIYYFDGTENLGYN